MVGVGGATKWGRVGRKYYLGRGKCLIEYQVGRLESAVVQGSRRFIIKINRGGKSVSAYRICAVGGGPDLIGIYCTPTWRVLFSTR